VKNEKGNLGLIRQSILKKEKIKRSKMLKKGLTLSRASSKKQKKLVIKSSKKHN
jgi:hypothetical protein